MKRRERLRAVEVVLNAIVNLLHKKNIISREEIQMQILEDDDDDTS